MADDTLPGDAENFSAQPEGEAALGYVANFSGDEIEGKVYQMGDKIASGLDAGTIRYLVENGRITPTTPDSAGSPSGGTGATGIPNGDGGSGNSEADALVKDNTADELRTMAADEGVELAAGDTKAEIAAKILAARK